MKLKLLTVLLLLSGTIWGQAREDDTIKKPDLPVRGPSPYVALCGGAQLPVGPYRMKGYFANYNGTIRFATGPYTKIGEAVNISTGLPIGHSSFGIAGMAAYYTNVFDIDKYVADMNRASIGRFYAISSTAAKTGTLLTGLFCTLPYTKFSIDFRFMAGIVFMQTSSIAFNGTDYTTGFNGNYSVGSNIAFTSAFNMGAQFRYHFNKQWAGVLGGDFFFTSLVFKAYQGYSPFNPNSDLIVVNLLAVTTGIAYTF